MEKVARKKPKRKSRAVANDLWQRAEQGGVKELSQLLEQGVDIDASSDRLERACCNGRSAEVVVFLLDQGIDPNESSKKGGWTALHYSGVGDFPDGVTLLLEHGASIDARNKEGLTPLHIAARYASTRAIRSLLEAGADPQATDKKGHTPMWELIGEKEIYELRSSASPSAHLLLEHGALANERQARLLRTLQRNADRQREKISRFPWSKLETRIARLFSKAIIAFAKQHKEEVFCGFGLDCNVQEGGQILLCLNTVEHLKSKEGSAPRDERYRWSPGDWAHGELAVTTRSAGWDRAIRPLLIDGYIESETAERMLECACEAALRIVDDGVLDSLVRGEEFVVLVIDHDEGVEQARARMARVIAGRHS